MSAQNKQPQSVVAATHNPDKLVEMREILQGFDISFISLDHFPQIESIEETGTTLEENSMIKARVVHQITKLPVIADDTGLEVDALDGAPGVYTGRYAGENASYSENIEKLLLDLKDIPENERTAQFRTVVTYLDDTTELQAEGKVQGVITTAPMGEMGFGYDPVFFVPGKNRTFAQLKDGEKNAISHRGLALQNLRKLLWNRI